MQNVVVKIVRKYYTLHKNTKILEVGCGDGRHLFALNQHVDGLLVGAEYSLECFLGKKGQAVKFFSCDAVYLPFKQDSFDIIFSNSFFEHVYDPKLAFLEQLRVLKHSGILIIVTPNLLNPKNYIIFFVTMHLRQGSDGAD